MQVSHMSIPSEFMRPGKKTKQRWDSQSLPEAVDRGRPQSRRCQPYSCNGGGGLHGAGARLWGESRTETSPKLCQARQWEKRLNTQHTLDSGIGIIGQSLNNQITLCFKFLRGERGMIQVPSVQGYREDSERALVRC